MIDHKIGFIGAGNMAEAIINSLIEKSVFDKENIFISEPDDKRREYFLSRYGVNLSGSNRELVDVVDIIVLAVKPQVMRTVLEDSFSDFKLNDGRKLIISIAAGIACSDIEDIIYPMIGKGGCFPVVRTMPNTPAMASMGMTGIAGGRFAEEKDIRLVNEIMSSFGNTLVVDEDKIDSITAVSGSGPAYFFYFVESLINGALKLGFSREDASLLVMETAKGALALMEKTGESPSVLREKVTSKGGTTEAALNVMKEKGLEDIILKALGAARDRAVELSS